MLKYKINVLKELKKAGYNSTVILEKRLFAQRAMQSLRENKMIGTTSLNRICHLLNLQPGDIIEYVDEPGEFEQTQAESE